MKKLYSFLFPKYARLPLLLVLVFNCLVYWIPPLIQGDDITRYSLAIQGVDNVIPFIPAFIVVYVLSYVQWAFSYIYHCHESRELCYRMTTSDLIAKAITLVFFIALPAEIVRPDVTDGGIFNWLTQLIYSMDKPISLFPSIHCLESWMCFRTATMMAKRNRWYSGAQFVFTLLVFASVVFVKQHFFVDILGGIAVVEIGLFVYKKWETTHIFEKLQLPSAR